MKFTDLIPVDCIVPELHSTSKESAIKEILEVMGLSKRAITQNHNLIMERETMGTTGMGEGIALPHSNRSSVKEIKGAFGRSIDGVDFNALDGKPVHLIFLILSSDSQKSLHIEGLKYISRQMRNDIYKKFLMQAPNKDDIYKVFREIDQKAE